VATLRNARGGNNPDVVKFALFCEQFGAEGITVHPRPDGRHIRYEDVRNLKKVVSTEFNIEGYPDPDFIDLILEVVPEQVTLVPDAPDALTSNAGWDTVAHFSFLREVVDKFRDKEIRVSIFIEPEKNKIRKAAELGADRVELYTEPYASLFPSNPQAAVHPFVQGAIYAFDASLGLNAGHDLSLENLRYFAQHVPHLQEVSIGHALICDALYFGLENTIQMYRRQLEEPK
jgi:pyridoxine 5-phosphate synthase